MAWLTSLGRSCSRLDPKFVHLGFHEADRIFGIKDEDRLLHLYVIGKTGTGKSTLLENMALQDLERGHGFALIDPHGDLVARIASRVSASRRGDIIYLDATDPNQPYGYNPLRHCGRIDRARRLRHDGCLQENVARRPGRAHGARPAQRAQGAVRAARRDTS